MVRRTIAPLVTACVVVGVSGCGTQPYATWTPPTAAAASATPAASPTVDRSALQDRAKAATIPAKGLSMIGVSTGPKADKPVAFDVARPCGRRTSADQNDLHVAYNRTWSAQGWWVSNTVHAYGTVAGAIVVRQVRASAESCTTYTGSDEQYTMHGAVSLPVYPDVDAGYGYCLTAKRTDGTYVSCLSFFARGNLVSSVWVVHGATQQTNTSGVQQVSAIAVDALLKAA
jgi:hypothetical protein